MASIKMPPVLLISKRLCGYVWSFNKKLTFKSSSSFCVASSYTTDHGSVVSPVQEISNQPLCRRSGNYRPSIWDFDFVQNVNSQCHGERDSKRASELKTQLRMMLENQQERVDQLEFIDDLHKLGISYHFEDEIKQILTRIYEQRHLENRQYEAKQGNLYTEALQFRLLRQHGLKVPQEVFDCFKNEKGEFKSSLENDTKGLLELYEASHLLVEGEDTLEQAREYATILLQGYLDNAHGDSTNNNLVLNVRFALEQPLHWRVQRPNARWYINTYERREDMNNEVLEFAKLDFNLLQAAHQEELKHVSRWWKRTCLAESMPYARDRLVECYFWTLGFLYEPQYANYRIMTTKCLALITMIDDTYDIYGTVEELQLFTDFIERWDVNTLEKLPTYMQMCCIVLNTYINDLSYDVLKDQGYFFMPYIRKTWADLCKAYFQEAKWFAEAYTPTMEEYVENAWVSISANVIISNAYFLVANPINTESVKSLHEYHDIIRWSGTIFRLADDLGTALAEMERGDVPKSIQCYMKETGATEKEAREHVANMMRDVWKKMNEELLTELPFPKACIRSAVDLGRMSMYMYGTVDMHGTQHSPLVKDRIDSVLFKPIV